jgi:hypothetical protein
MHRPDRWTGSCIVMHPEAFPMRSFVTGTSTFIRSVSAWELLTTGYPWYTAS